MSTRNERVRRARECVLRVWRGPEREGERMAEHKRKYVTRIGGFVSPPHRAAQQEGEPIPIDRVTPGDLECIADLVDAGDRVVTAHQFRRAAATIRALVARVEEVTQHRDGMHDLVMRLDGKLAAALAGRDAEATIRALERELAEAREVAALRGGGSPLGLGDDGAPPDPCCAECGEPCQFCIRAGGGDDD